MKKWSTYPSLPLHIEKLIFYAFPNSFHDLLYAQMQIIFPVETVSECESHLLLS